MNHKNSNSIPIQGIAILRNINEVIGQLKHLESDCITQSGLLQKCEKQLFAVTIDVASVCCDSECDIPHFIDEAGIRLPDDLDADIREVFTHDDDCLK